MQVSSVLLVVNGGSTVEVMDVTETERFVDFRVVVAGRRGGEGGLSRTTSLRKLCPWSGWRNRRRRTRRAGRVNTPQKETELLEPWPTVCQAAKQSSNAETNKLQLFGVLQQPTAHMQLISDRSTPMAEACQWFRTQGRITLLHPGRQGSSHSEELFSCSEGGNQQMAADTRN